MTQHAADGSPPETFTLHHHRFAVLDSEFTAWEGSMQRDWGLDWEHRELVQLGIVIMQAEQDDGGSFRLREIGSSCFLVRPEINPHLSDYFTALTGITNADLARTAMSFDEAMDRLSGLTAEAGDILCYGQDGAIICEQCRLLGRTLPIPAHRFRDIRPLLRWNIPHDIPPYSGDLLALLGLVDTATRHDALADARSVALSFAELVHRGRIVLRIDNAPGSDAAPTPPRPPLLPDHDKADVLAEYRARAGAAADHEKALWGSEQSMLGRFHFALAVLDWRPVRSWLDIGCSSGRFFVEAEAAGRRFDRLYGIDLVPELVEAALHREFNSPTDFAVADLETLPADPGRFGPDRFDLVTLIGVLQKCGMPLDRALAAAAAPVASGGILFLTTKNIDWNAFDRPGFAPEANHCWFRLDDILAALAGLGFEIVDYGGLRPVDAQRVPVAESHSLFVTARRITG